MIRQSFSEGVTVASLARGFGAKPWPTMTARAGCLDRQVLAGTMSTLASGSFDTRSTGRIPPLPAPQLVRAMFSTSAVPARLATLRRATTVMVGNLPGDFDDQKLKHTFSICGKIEATQLRMRQYAVPLRSGYIRFASRDSAENALRMNRRDVGGRPVYVAALYEIADTVKLRSLPPDVDSDRVKGFFSSCGEVIVVRIHTPLTGEQVHQSYGFVRFASPKSVAKALELNGTTFDARIIRVDRAFQRAKDVTIWENYAQTAEMTARSIVVQDLPPQINEDQLKVEFLRCGEIDQARVWREQKTGKPTGVGFVMFASPESVPKALELTKEIAGQPLRVVQAGPIRPKALDLPYGSRPDRADPTNTLLVGRLAPDVSISTLRREFERFGAIAAVHHTSGRSRAYIEYTSPSAVELAVRQDNKFTIDGFSVKLMRDYSGSPSSWKPSSPSQGRDRPGSELDEYDSQPEYGPQN